MSGHQMRCSNTSSCLNHPKHVSFLTPNPGWSQSPTTGANSFKCPCTLSDLEFSSGSSPLEQSDSPSSPEFPVRRLCMGRSYNSKYAEMNHLVNRPKMAEKPANRGSLHCLLCTDRPSDPSSPTFLNQLIRGIKYLDRSTNAFHTNCPKSPSLPRLATSCLEQAANAILRDHPDHAFPHSHSNPSTSIAASDTTGTCRVLSTRGVNDLQSVDDSVNASRTRQLHSHNLTPMLPQKPEIKLPELPLFGKWIFPLGNLPKFWGEICSGGSTPETSSKPSSWW